MSDVEQEEVAAEADSDEEVASTDNDSIPDISDGKGKEMTVATVLAVPAGRYWR